MDDSSIGAALRALGSRHAVAELTPTTSADSTHLVIGPTGVWLVDGVAGEGEYLYVDGTLTNGSVDLRDSMRVAEKRATAIGEILQLPASAVVCLPDAQLARPAQLIDRVRVAEPAALTTLIGGATVQLTPHQIADAIGASQILPITKPAAWHPPPDPLPKLRHATGPTRRRGNGLRYAVLGFVVLMILVALISAVSLTAFTAKLNEQRRPVPAAVSCVDGKQSLTLAWPGDLDQLDHYQVTLEQGGTTTELGDWFRPETVTPPQTVPAGAHLILTTVSHFQDGSRSLPAATTLDVPTTPC